MGCVFCEKIAEQRDAENFILKRGAHCFVIMNIYPYSNGHLMVVPYEHTPSLETLCESALSEMMALTNLCTRTLAHAMRPTGFNIGMNLGAAAGAGVADHVHQHIVPRWVGDTNFMSVIGDARVIPQSLQTCHDLLCQSLAVVEAHEDLSLGSK